MSDLPFDIDDILNEINKRKEEFEREIDSVSVNIEDAQSKAAEKKAEPKNVEASPQPAPVDPAPEKLQAIAENEKPQADPEPVEEAVAVPAEAPEEAPVEEPAPEADEAHYVNHDISASYFADVDRIFAEADNAAEPAEEKEAEDGAVNLFDFAENIAEDGEDTTMKRAKRADKKQNKSKKRKVIISVILIVAIVLAGVGTFGYFYIDKMLGHITPEENNREDGKTEEWSGMDTLIEKFNDIYEESDVDSYRDFAKKWYYNGDPVSSTHILNVILIGEDTRGEEITDAGNLADSVIIASVNVDTGELVLSSILRDTYAYYELVPGDESTGTYGKLNEAMSYGNLNAYINAVERLYKVNIDNYVLVNFSNFKQIIDILGGVTVEMTAAEIREINNHPGTYGNVYIEGDAGEKLLTGEQALAYSRIRHIDSDIYRSERQRTVLLNVFQQLKDASLPKLTRLVTTLLPYVKTGFTKNEIIEIGTYGFSHGWLGYKVVTHTVPINETKADGTVVNVWTDDTSYGSATLKVDIPLAAQVLQEKIYGKTNVVLAEDRPNFRYLSAY